MSIKKKNINLCLYFNIPPKYREEIYTRIEQEYDCSWYFEMGDVSIKSFDLSQLKSWDELATIKLGGFYWTKGLLCLLLKDYSHYIMIGATRNLSLYIFLILKNLFFRKKKVALWTHGYYGKESRIELHLFKLPLLKMANMILLYGDYARDLMIKHGFSPNKLLTIHNSLAYTKQMELRKSIQPSNIYKNHFCNLNPVLIFLGRLTPVKKLDMILDAMAKLKMNGEEYNMVFVGGGIVRERLEKQTADLGLTNHVWFYGACYDESQNAELVYNADLCVAPGNVGLTAMHMMMFGCPVITHNDFKWQMPEFESIVQGKTGTFFEKGNVDSLAENISAWFKQKNTDRENVRNACYTQMDDYWNPDFQMEVINKALQ